MIFQTLSCYLAIAAFKILLLFLGFEGGRGSEVKFNEPYGCTAYGANIAIADSGNKAIRSFATNSSAVTTIIEFYVIHHQAYDDNAPKFVEAINSTHLLVVFHLGKARLINTTSGNVAASISIAPYSHVSSYTRCDLGLISIARKNSVHLRK